jgi:UDP-hydrolysing UDP-N-acetyl-D-glucosamine 2-epimerase
MKKIAVVLVDRANYGRLKPVMKELSVMEGIQMHTVCAGTMLLERFGRARDVVARDGFTIDSEVYLEVEGSAPITMTKSIGLGVIEFASEFQRLKPDFALIIGDRYEAMAAAIAAAYQNICIIHVQGGEVTGSIDESTRHAISKLAHYHFPATARAGRYIEAMGEDPATIFPLGCPSCDVVHGANKELPFELLKKSGVGPEIDFSKPYLQVLFHPVTTDYGNQEEQMEEVLKAILELNIQTLLLWPNIDAGADEVSQAIRRFREFHHDFPLRAYKNFEPEIYIPLLYNAACCIGNSSSFVRETSFFGTPVVLVGSRQDGREWAPSVKRVEPLKAEIIRNTKEQLEHGRHPVSDLYGTPGVCRRIAKRIPELKPYSQKKLHYVSRSEML